MQLDTESLSAIIGALTGLVTSVATTLVGHGIMNEKVRRLEEDVRSHKDDLKAAVADQDDFVTYTHFNAVVEPLRRTLENVQKDVKEILVAVSKNGP